MMFEFVALVIVFGIAVVAEPSYFSAFAMSVAVAAYFKAKWNQEDIRFLAKDVAALAILLREKYENSDE